MKRRQERDKKKRKHRRKPKFPKEPKKPIKSVSGEPLKISEPFNPVLGTAHRGNRFNELFNVKPEELPRDESMPHLNQWISEALTAIAYKSSKAHHLTKRICFPQRGWKRMKQRIGIRERGVLTYVLRNIAIMFKRLRDHYLDKKAPKPIECLEESDLLWQNILEPLTGVVQIMCEVVFRGHTHLEIHRIDGLKLARAVRIVGEELGHTATLMDNMMGHVATRWYKRTVEMALQTSKQWRMATIKRMGLEGVVPEEGDDEDEDIKELSSKLIAKLKVRGHREEILGLLNAPQEEAKKGFFGWVKKLIKRNPATQEKAEADPTDFLRMAKKSSYVVQAKTEAGPSNSSSTVPVPRKEPKTRGPSVLLQHAIKQDPMQAILEARARKNQERDELEYTQRSALRTAMEDLENIEDPARMAAITRAYTPARNRPTHSGLQMHHQDMEMDPLRMAQINGPVSPGNTYIPSYAAFPAARFTDNRVKIETQSQNPVPEEKKDKGKGKEVERRSALKKPKAEIPESNGNNEKTTPQQSESGKGIKPADGAPRMKSSDGIVAQVKARFRSDRDTRVEAHAPPSHKENEKPSTSGGPSNTEVLSRPMSFTKGDDTVEIAQRPRVRFANASPPAGDLNTARRGGESSGTRKDDEPSGSTTRDNRDSLTTHSGITSPRSRIGRRESSNRPPIEPSTNTNGRMVPLPYRIGGEVVPAPPTPRMRSTRSHSPFVVEGRDNMVPAPLRVRYNRDQTLLENSDKATPAESKIRHPPPQSPFMNQDKVMTAPLRLRATRSQSPFANEGGQTVVPAPPKPSHSRAKSPFVNEGGEMVPPAPKPTHSRAKSPLENEVKLEPPRPRFHHSRSRSPLENRGVGFGGGGGGLSGLSVMSFADYNSNGTSPAGPPPNRPLPPLPTKKE
ncbi:hypothetical protein V497_02948 [Pseudogymnoascus sp. VKM F-4516 (FW-969)]|nr:hypothetical protein V497_02948 [Pseudogymnoascus sp. VKM F-4516 (FW-969)]